MNRPATDSESLVDPLIEAVPGGVVHVGPDGAVRRANPAALAFLGFSYDALTRRYTQDFAGDTWFEDGTPCGHEHYPVAITLTTGQPSGPTTIGVRQPDGALRWAVFRAVPVEGGGAVVTFLDITERREAERRLRISDRLASLGRLAAGVAHEVNNPLTWVTLNLERALEERDPREGIERALEGVARVASIVRDLGAFARVDDAEPAPFDVHESVEQAIAIARAEVQHRAELVVRRGQVPLAFGHGSRTVQILLNLLLNAAQAIPPGNRQVHRIEVETRAPPGRVVVLVRDTGQGMAPGTLEHALDPFFTTKGPGEGTGLGLAISHALASAMGGTLELESAQGQGTTVRLTIPAADGAAPSAPRPIRPPEPAAVAARVLVCDDEPEIGRIVAWALAPHHVRVAASGREALELLAESDWDVLICDLMMPDVTGMALHAHLASNRPDLLARTVFVTGGAYTDEARAFLDRADVRSLRKPFRVAEVREVVAELLRPR